MKTIPDNVVYNELKNEYDAYKKPYPSSLSSPNFEKNSIQKIPNSAIAILKAKFNEINNEYKKFIENVNHNEMVNNSKFNFKPIAGKEYYLYRKDNYNFSSIIKPDEWKQKFVGSFVMLSSELWKKKK